MIEEHSNKMKLSEQVEILYNLFHGNKISPLCEELGNNSIVELQKFMWEKTVEFGILSHGKDFDRKIITRKMTPTSTYQRLQGCSETAYNCKGTDCIKSNPNCARNKIKEHVDIMAETIWEFIGNNV